MGQLGVKWKKYLKLKKMTSSMLKLYFYSVFAAKTSVCRKTCLTNPSCTNCTLKIVSPHGATPNISTNWTLPAIDGGFRLFSFNGPRQSLTCFTFRIFFNLPILKNCLMMLPQPLESSLWTWVSGRYYQNKTETRCQMQKSCVKLT